MVSSISTTRITSALIYRDVLALSLWKGHPYQKVTSAETLLDTFHNSDYVKVKIVIGSPTYLSKQRSSKVIDRAWGVDWVSEDFTRVA